jgi:hypothetical protein
VKRL